MTKPSEETKELRERCQHLKQKIASLGDLRPGSLVERYRKCGKPQCHCAREGERGHGPSWSLTREVAGRTVTSVIPSEAVSQTRQQVAEYQRFRALAKELVETSDRACDGALRAARAASEGEAEKGGSRRTLRRRSRKKSKR